MVHLAAWSVLAALGASALAADAPAPAGDARRGSWDMVPSEVLAPIATHAVKTYKPIFSQGLAPAEVATIVSETRFAANGLPLAKGSAQVTIPAGARFYRMRTSDPALRVYCGGGVGYSANGGMIKVSLRTCLGDDDGDGRFDRYMTGMVVPTRPVDSLLLALLRIDTAGIGPVLIGSRTDNRIELPYAAGPGMRLFAAGPVLVRSGSKYGLALAIGERGEMRLLRPFDVAREPPPSADLRYESPKSFGFADATPIDLSQLPADLDFMGARLRVHAIKGDEAQVEVLQGFPSGIGLAVAYTGLLDASPK